MNVKLAWDFALDAHKSLFPETELFDWEKDLGTTIDLLIFPGGEDVSLHYYASRDTITAYSHLCYSNDERDEAEFRILDGCYNGRLRVNKILGICRGLQFLNVANDGKLYPDLDSQGIGHGRIHTIQHRVASNLRFFETVNSMHHQGISEIGKYNRQGDRSYPTIIASDKNGYVPEIVTWDNDRVLAVQFHPEFFWNETPEKAKFIEFCRDWVAGKKTILL